MVHIVFIIFANFASLTMGEMFLSLDGVESILDAEQSVMTAMSAYVREEMERLNALKR